MFGFLQAALGYNLSSSFAGPSKYEKIKFACSDEGSPLEVIVLFALSIKLSIDSSFSPCLPLNFLNRVHWGLPLAVLFLAGVGWPVFLGYLVFALQLAAFSADHALVFADLRVQLFSSSMLPPPPWSSWEWLLLPFYNSYVPFCALNLERKYSCYPTPGTKM